MNNGIVATVCAILMALPGSSAALTLDFEAIAPYPNEEDVWIEQFYNGGTSSIGTSGIDYGVSFGSRAQLLCLNSTTIFCSDTSRGGVGDAGSRQGSLLFRTGPDPFLNVAAGFTSGVSFNYVSQFGGSIDIFDGLNGTGNLLASLPLSANAVGCADYVASFCPFGSANVLFAGTARSISFADVVNRVVFDDITLVPSRPVIPEPATWAMMIAGFGLIGGAFRRRRPSCA